MIQRVLRHLIFLPNLMPLSAVLQTEIFPWATLYSLRSYRSFPPAYRAFLAFLGLSALWMWWVEALPVLSVARSLFAFANASLIFFSVLHSDEEEYQALLRAFTRVALINLVLVFLQYSHLFPVFLEPFMRWFIERFQAQPIGDGRGVAGLFAEPSYAGISLYYFFAFFIFRQRIEPTSSRGLWLMVALLLVHLLMIRSLAALFFLLIFVAVSVPRRQWLRLLAPVLLVFALLVAIFGSSDQAPRALAVPYAFVLEQEYRDPVPWLLRHSGFRFVSVAASYTYLLSHPLGAGLGAWPSASLEGLEAIGVPTQILDHLAAEFQAEFNGLRPYSFAAGLALEGGWPALILLFWALRPSFLHTLWRRDFRARTLLAFFLFSVVVMGTIGDPLPFLFLALVLRQDIKPARALP